MDTLERRLLNDFQRDFPLVEEPFAVIANALRSTESWVLGTLARCANEGSVSRVGAVFRPGAVGASTLAAMAVPEGRLPAVAQLVSAHPEINHNYEREHALNLWFVATAADGEQLARVLDAIERETELPVVAMPLVADYHIDLGFDLSGCGNKPRTNAHTKRSPLRLALHAADRALIGALQGGMPFRTRPFAALAERAGWRGAEAERQVRARIADWLAEGAIKRVGIIVRHRALGYVANAMCVWDIPAHEADRLGRALAAEPAVTLCYRRARAGALWPYNLFCMIHGRDRSEVEAELALLSARHGLAAYPHAVLFSRRAFKQRGARYVEVEEVVNG